MMCSIDDAIKALADNQVVYRNEDYSLRIINRLRYLQDQGNGVKPKLNKGKYRSDWWTCGNCGSKTYDGVVANFCWNCGYRILWDSCRCLTK